MNGVDGSTSFPLGNGLRHTPEEDSAGELEKYSSDHAGLVGMAVKPGGLRHGQDWLGGRRDDELERLRAVREEMHRNRDRVGGVDKHPGGVVWMEVQNSRSAWLTAREEDATEHLKPSSFVDID